jgi:response regulator of citrate/malate metabolism
MTRPTRVLVVDDDFRVARVHAGFVEGVPGFAVVGSARSGAEALELASRHDPDIVLLDVHLPDMDGIAVLRELRARGSTAGVLMVTAERDVDVVRAALSSGATQYLVKPFPRDDLVQRLRQVQQSLSSLGGLRDGEADQATIDRAFSRPEEKADAALPKGLSSTTADLVLGALRERGEQSAAGCAEALGLSRVTARRYLEHFVASGAAQVRLNYGGSGRPEHLYRPS